MSANESAILLIHCRDQRGLVATVADFINRHGGNILHLDQHVDRQKGVFFMRAEWELSRFDLKPGEIETCFDLEIGRKFAMSWRLFYSEQRSRMAIFVSKFSHCLYDLLARCQDREWQVDVSLIISNHPGLEKVAKGFEIPFYHIPITKDNKVEQEKKQLTLLKEHQVDVVVLARYMQIIGQEFVETFPNQIINIHHSFLPAFVGARPYHAAYERGVKIIGATSHYVTKDLDAGPIIEQGVVTVSHKDSVEDLIRQGQDLEKIVLAKAVYSHLMHRVLVYDNRTVVF
ncbi:MAG: formyltetrahydrofolate deformylase [Verrucomicrobiota bacterium]